MNAGRKIPSIPTWPLKHSKAALEALVGGGNEAMFNRGYRMQAVSPGDLKFPSFSKCWQKGIVLGELQRRGMPAYIGVDLAGKNRKGNAIAVVGLDSERRRHLLEIKYGAWTSPETAAALADVCTRHNVQYIQVENNAYQQAIIDWVRKEKADFPYWMRIEAYTTGSGKMQEDIGLPVLEVEFKNGAWVFPYSEWENHASTCRCDWCHLAVEISMYPRGATSDGLMAMFFARDAANKWSPINTSPHRLGRLNRR